MMTKQRKLIHQIICLSPMHLSAEEIYFEAKKQCPSIAVGTVYRNLNLMAEEGQITKIETAGQPVRFDKNVIPHEHFFCTDCGRLFDLDLKGIKEFISEQTGMDVEGYTLSVRCRCAECRLPKGA
ncbi:MAG: transcriptional repressor [Clostridia bacterium]|nr:transcriptional repressor [Clostridia bacterium]